jgi:hypothetical protein
MSNVDTPTLTLAAAQQLLRLFTSRDRDSAGTSLDPAVVRAAVLLVREHSDYQIFGICADTLEQAIAALHDYLTALGYPMIPTLPTVSGTVYVKFNPKTGHAHVDSYTGQYRGVLVSCQSAYDGDVNETYGHLPLELFRQLRS